MVGDNTLLGEQNVVASVCDNTIILALVGDNTLTPAGG
jgi:hypothetical protein